MTRAHRVSVLAHALLWAGCGLGVTGTATDRGAGPGAPSATATSVDPTAPSTDDGGDANVDAGVDAPVEGGCVTQVDCDEQQVCAGGVCRLCGEPGSDGLKCNGKGCKTCNAAMGDCHCD